MVLNFVQVQAYPILVVLICCWGLVIKRTRGGQDTLADCLICVLLITRLIKYIPLKKFALPDFITQGHDLTSVESRSALQLFRVVLQRIMLLR